MAVRIDPIATSPPAILLPIKSKPIPAAYITTPITIPAIIFLSFFSSYTLENTAVSIAPIPSIILIIIGIIFY